jgi:NAD(P)-dependent dehydrogenase (short-subunit alcohol dehydrogenase family)
MGKFDEGFEGLVALVTGGASGIGLATARRLSAEGAVVVIADFNESGAKAAAEAIGAEFVVFDVGDPEAWQETIHGIEAQHGALHLVHLNAGITTYKAEASAELRSGFDLSEMPLDNYRRIMGANVDGVILGARACIPLIAASGGGAVVATASAAGAIAFPPDPIYTATKHAVVGFVRSMAPWLQAQGIGCHAIMPGVVDTGLLAEGMADQARTLGIPVIAPEEIAEAVVGAVRSPESGGLWVCLANRPAFRYAFNPIDGLGVPETD